MSPSKQAAVRHAVSTGLSHLHSTRLLSGWPRGLLASLCVLVSAAGALRWRHASPTRCFWQPLRVAETGLGRPRHPDPQTPELPERGFHRRPCLLPSLPESRPLRTGCGGSTSAGGRCRREGTHVSQREPQSCCTSQLKWKEKWDPGHGPYFRRKKAQFLRGIMLFPAPKL